MKKLILLPILLTIILLSCGKETPLSTEEKSQRGTISGTVTDTAGVPIIGVGVTVSGNTAKPGGYTTQTDTLGQYTIPDVEAGLYQVTFTHGYFLPSVFPNVSIAKAEDGAIPKVVLKTKFAKLSGIVKDLQGKPVDKATVSISPRGLTATTDSNGVYTIEGITLEKTVVSVTKTNFVTSTDTITFTPDTFVVTKQYLITEKKGTVTGIVKNSAGKLLPSVIVTTVPGGLTAETDANGQYTLTNLTLDQLYSLSFSLAGYQAKSASAQATELLPNATVAATLTETPGSVTGTITNSSGALLPGAVVRVTMGDSTYEGTSNTVGVYTITGIPHGTGTVSVSLDEYAPTTLPVAISLAKKDVSLNVALNNSPGKFTGVVTDEKNIPLENVAVNTGKYSAVTKADGSYELPVGALATYTLTFTKKNYESSSSTALTLSSASPSSIVNMALKAKTGSLSGIVKNSANTHLGGVVVTTLPGGFTDTTDATGAYSFAGLTLDQLYSVTFTKVGYETGSIPAQLNEVAPSAILEPLVLLEVPGSITGTVTNSSGVVLAGVAVNVVIGTKAFTGITNTVGVYAISGITHGTGQITFTSDKFASKSEQVSISLDAKDLTVDAVLKPSPGKFVGVVTDANGLPLENVNVTSGGNSTFTIADGTYELALDALGTYALTFTKLNYTAQTSAALSLTNSAPVGTVNMVLTAKVGTISGVVKNGANESISGATVTTTPGGFSVVTDANGAYSLPSLQMGIEYSISWSKTGYVQYSNKYTVDEITPLLSVNPVLVEQKGSIMGTVVDLDGAPAGGAAVKLASPQGTADAIVGTDGMFKIDSLVPGNYKVTIEGGAGFTDTILTDSVMITKNATKDMGIIKVMRTFNRSVIGSFIVHKDTVDSVVAEYREINAVNWTRVKCSYGISYGFSGKLDINEAGSTWIVRVKTYAKDRKIGQSSEALFTKTTADINFASSFTDPTNAIPTVTISADPSANINKEVVFTANETDLDSGKVVSIEWTFGDGSTATGKKVSHTYLTEKSFPVQVKVTDDDGNTAVAVHNLNVINPNTVITGLGTGMKATINDEKTFTITATDENGIKKYLWYNDAVLFAETTVPTAKTILSTTAKPVSITVKAIDNFDDTTSASVSITVTNQKPDLKNVTFPTTVKAGDSIKIQFTATDDGTMSYSYDAGATGTFTKCDSGKIAFVAPNILDADYPVKIKVSDEDNNDSIVTVTVGVNVWSTTMSGDTSLTQLIINGSRITTLGYCPPSPDPFIKEFSLGGDAQGEKAIPFVTAKALSLLPSGSYVIAGSKPYDSYHPQAWWIREASASTPWDVVNNNASTHDSASIVHVSTTSDGGYIAGGWVYSMQKYPLVVKVNSSGVVQWQKMVTYTNGDTKAVFQNANGTSSLFMYDGQMITLDATGNALTYTAVLPSGNYPGNFSKASDGNFLFKFGAATDIIQKIKPDGTKLWSYSTGYHKTVLSENSTGDIAYASEGAGIGDLWVGSLTSSGAVKITGKLIKASFGIPVSIAATADGGYVVLCTTTSGSKLLKLDADLNTQKL